MRVDDSPNDATASRCVTARGRTFRRRMWGALLAAVVTAGSILVPVAPSVAAGNASSWFDKELGYAKLRDQGLDGAGVTIAIAETGVDLNSPDLQGADIEFVPMPDECLPIREASKSAVDLDRRTYEDSVAHGTQVATMIVGQGGDGRIQGVAPKAKLLVMEQPFAITPASSAWPSGCDEMVFGGGRMMEAEKLGADIMSMSLLGPTQPTSYQNAYWQVRGKALITGAGNDGKVSAESAGLPGVVSVTASQPGGAATNWAAAGKGLTVAAPGEKLTLREADGKLVSNGAGTSFSSPIVAGTLALGHQKWPDATYHQLIHSLTETASNGGRQSRELGFGVIDPVVFIDNDPMQYPDEPITYPGMANDDPQWDVVRQLCDGFALDSTMAYPEHYKADAGLDPEAVVWLPQVAKDEGWLGMAPNAGEWANGSDTPSDVEPADDVAGPPVTPATPAQPATPVTPATPAQPAGFPTLAVIGIAAGVIVVLALIVVLTRRKNRTAHAGPSQQYPPQQYPPQEFAPNQQQWQQPTNQQWQEPGSQQWQQPPPNQQ